MLQVKAQHTGAIQRSAAAAAAASKRRHSRVRTGCRECRQRRVKCPEGSKNAEGKKAACWRCTSSDIPCYYPRLRVSYTDRTEWEEAWKEQEGGMEEEGVFLSPSMSSGGLTVTSPCSEWDASSLGGPSQRDWAFFLQDMMSSSSGSSATTSGQLQMYVRPEDQPSDMYQSPQRFSQASISDDLSEATLTLIQEDQVENVTHATTVLYPSPSTLFMRTSCLSSIPHDMMDRSVVHFFESQGCSQIVPANKPQTNWIHTLLFPHLLHLMSHVSSAPSSSSSAFSPSLSSSPSDAARGLIRSYAYHSFLRLCYVHRGNMGPDDSGRAHYQSQADIHQRKADLSALKVRFEHDEADWQTEEYLMAFFTYRMADLLSSKQFAVNRLCIFAEPKRARTGFSASLTDLIAVYSTFVAACAPNDPYASQPALARNPFELSLSGDEWVESFFGQTRQIIVLFGWVNKMIKYRYRLLQQYHASFSDGSNSLATAKVLVKLQALRSKVTHLLEGIATPRWASSPWATESSKSKRIERGTLTMRTLTLVLIHAELLDTDLSNACFLDLRAALIEIIADIQPSETAGLLISMAITAIYTPHSDREEVHALLSRTRDWSFGPGYESPMDMVQACWDIYDEKGRYKDGIAPWREAMHASGRSLFL